MNVSNEPLGEPLGESGDDFSCLIDFKELTARLENDAELISEVLTAFSVDAPLRIDLISRAIESGDLETALTESHTMKGMCAVLGISSLVILAGSMERAAGKGDVDKLTRTRPLLERDTGKALSEIESYLAASGLK